MAYTHLTDTITTNDKTGQNNSDMNRATWPVFLLTVYGCVGYGSAGSAGEGDSLGKCLQAVGSYWYNNKCNSFEDLVCDLGCGYITHAGPCGRTHWNNQWSECKCEWKVSMEAKGGNKKTCCAAVAPPTTDTPTATTRAPTCKPSLTVNTSSPTLTTQTPTRSTLSPTDSTSAPTPSTRSPTDSTSAPTPGTRSPTDSTSAPTPSTMSPTDSTMSPTDSTMSPTDSTRSPTDSTSAPTPSTMSPTDSTMSPTDSTMSPTDGTRSPTDSTSAPTDSTQSPTDSTMSPTDNTLAPTPSTASPTGGTLPPTLVAPPLQPTADTLAPIGTPVSATVSPTHNTASPTRSILSPTTTPSCGNGTGEYVLGSLAPAASLTVDQMCLFCKNRSADNCTVDAIGPFCAVRNNTCLGVMRVPSNASTANMSADIFTSNGIVLVEKFRDMCRNHSRAACAGVGARPSCMLMANLECRVVLDTMDTLTLNGSRSDTVVSVRQGLRAPMNDDTTTLVLIVVLSAIGFIVLVLAASARSRHHSQVPPTVSASRSH
jgi:hypothetical protein